MSAESRDESLIELRLQGPRVPHWLNDLGTRFGAVVKLHVCRSTEDRPRKLVRLLEITAPPDRLDQIADFLRAKAGRGHLAQTRVAPHRLIARLRTPLPAICQSVFDLGAICTSCPFLAEGDPEETEGAWGLIVPHAADAKPMLRNLRDSEGKAPRLLRVGKYRGAPELTPRQELAVHLAHRMGYFETPRRTDLEQLARALGVSRPTAMEILRRGMQKLAQKHASAPTATRAFGA